MREIAVIIPTYNNPKTIKAVVKDVKTHGYEAIVVDDGSEETIESLFNEDEKENIHFVKHEHNRGKGEAIKSGVTLAKELGFSYAGSIDGDGQHLASEMQKLIDVYEDDTIIIGARNLDLTHVPFVSKF